MCFSRTFHEVQIEMRLPNTLFVCFKETQRPRETFTKTFLSLCFSVIADLFPFLCGALRGQAKWNGLKMNVWVLKGAFVIFITFECAAVESVTAVPECHISRLFFIKMQNMMNRLDSLKKYEVQNWDKKLHLDSSRELWGERMWSTAAWADIYIYIYTAANTYPEMNWVYCAPAEEWAHCCFSLSLQTYSEETDIDLPTPSTKR